MTLPSLDRQTVTDPRNALELDGDAGPPAAQRLPAREWIARFTTHARQEGRVSASTLAAYALDLGTVARWAAGRDLGLLDLAAADLECYVAERLAAGAHRSTLARHLSSCRRFYGYLAGLDIIARNPATTVLVKRGTVPAARSGLQGDVLQAILRAPPCQPDEPGPAAFRAQRDHAIACLLYSSQLRVSQVRLLRWQQIDARGCLVRIVGRTGAVATVRLDPRLLAMLIALRECMVAAGFDFMETPYCFPTATGQPLTRQGLCQVVHRWAAEYGNARTITPSVLRFAGQANGHGRGISRAPAGVVHAGAHC